MSGLPEINAALAQGLPAASATLSDLGRRAIFPRGIPFQSAQARGTRYNGTIGQVTDGSGSAVPLPSLRAALQDLDPKMSHLYSPPPGHPALRDAWAARQRQLSGGSEVQTTRPFFTGGLTQGLSFLAELFVDPGRPALVPRPRWGNYDQTFAFRRGAALVPYEVFVDGQWSLEPLDRALSGLGEPAVLLLNYPHNPTGFTPTPEQAAALVARLAAHPHPLVIIVDDAYAGMIYEPSALQRSLFWELAPSLDPARHALFKVDGATKELLFFPGRVGFITAALDPEHPAAAALESKLAGLARSSVGSPTGPGQAATLRALEQPSLQQEIHGALAMLKERYQVLRASLDAVDNPALEPYPFNSGVFALIGVSGVNDIDALRQYLIDEHDVGVVSSADPPALRIAFCSVSAQDLPELVRRLDQGVRAWIAQN